MEDLVERFPVISGGRYDLHAIIGSGSSADVWRGHDVALDRRVAIKVFRDDAGDDRRMRERFQREARHIASLSHPNIVTVYDVSMEGEHLRYLVMEYVEGRSLEQILPIEAPPHSLVEDIALQTLAALQHAHSRGIVHRDIKPSNILVSDDGRVRLTDFGIAISDAATSRLTSDGAFVGTARYASPEQLLGRPTGRSSDLYSLGCVLYECIGGRPPFDVEDSDQLVLQHRFADPIPVEQLQPTATHPMSVAIGRALAKDPGERYATAADMAGAIRSSSTSSETPTDEHRVPNAAAVSPDRRSPNGLAPTEEGNGAIYSSPSGLHRRGNLVKVIAGVAVVGSVAAVLILLLTPSHRSIPRTTNGAAALPSGGFLQPGSSVGTMNGRFTLVMQRDGNLVEYGPGRSPVWATGTSGNFGAYVVVQSDGDVVLYPKGRSAPSPGQPTPALWSTGTYDHPESSVEIASDGVIRVRSKTGRTLWQTSAG